jgi:hypothetical protein
MVADQRIHLHHLSQRGEQLHLHRLTHSPVSRPRRQSTTLPWLDILARRADPGDPTDQSGRVHSVVERQHWSKQSIRGKLPRPSLHFDFCSESIPNANVNSTSSTSPA